MSEPERKDKVEEEEKPKRKIPPGWRNFQRVLKQVIKSPPLRKGEKGTA
jgi:hypothetical protein